MVHVYENRRPFCGGSILLPNIIITAAHCVEKETRHPILSGSSIVTEGTVHKVVRMLFHPHRQRHTHVNDIVLLKIYPPIDLVHSPNRRIPLYHGDIQPNSLGTVSGWGCNAIKW